ncbi:hypothetical protein OF83DRAFT_1215368 [Amylostereum chailletii]|nr:hypothetical protein OF83DRAFT_1215368 [Amylostereum chailletii]
MSLDVKPHIHNPPLKAAPSVFSIYTSPVDIEYTPENALREGLRMVKRIKSDVKRLELGTKLRKDVWLREIENLQGQGAPTTMIAVCGATGAGKSSILNAVLDDNVVPTSGMRACTATVTEIAYHKSSNIEADISFLTEKEWRTELEVLLQDLVDEDGAIKRTTNLNSDAGVAWSKVHAVYPSIAQDQLGGMTVDQIMARDPRIKKMLGTVKKIVAKDSKAFAQEVAKYVDSKEKKRGDNKDKKDKKDKNKEKSLSEILGNKPKNKEESSEGPAFWPLIRLVNVRCNSPALSTSAILVDLPGVADANAARNSIAKDYMKKCNCIWILAPITRAVDDKTAKDLLGDAFKTQLMSNYDDHTITFIASKCDDISCSEVIGVLGLDDDPTLEAIEERIDEATEGIAEWKPKENRAKAGIKDIDGQLKSVRAIIKEHEAHIEALENGETFVPKLTGKASKKKKAQGKKRKNHSGRKGSAKRRKASDDSDDDVDMDDDDDGDSFIVSDDDSDSEKEDEEDSEDDYKSGSDEEDVDKEDEEEEDEEVTVDILEAKIAEAKQAIKAGRERQHEFKKAKKEATDAISTLKKKQLKAQKEKNAFCSLKRSEYSRDALKEDFRAGLKELDDAAAEQRDPDSFDPSVNLRDYAAIDLPVFTCSSRDYIRLKGQVKGDGEPNCFSNTEDTGIPALQSWCHSLTISSRERAARTFMTHLKTFANSVKQYIENAGEITESDRAALKEKWESGYIEDEYDDDDDEDDEDDEDEDSEEGGGFAGLYQMGRGRGYNLDFNMLRIGMPAMKTNTPKVDAYGQPVGIVPRLNNEFKAVVSKTIAGLKVAFKEGLQEKCEAGAALAAAGAVEKSDVFAASMHWASYRATLRRHGTFRQDLNVELTAPMTKNIASSWAKVFEADLFANLQTAIMNSVNGIVKDVEGSAAVALKDRVKNQGELCVEEARVALKNVVEVVKDALNAEQKEVSRCLAPHVQGALIDGYEAAMEERGAGSVARQKAVFHNFVENHRHNIFDGGADTIMERLSKAAETVGAALSGRLEQLSEKIEVSIAVLWEGVKDDPTQIRVRAEVVQTMSDVIRQVNFWSDARELRERTAAEEEAQAEAVLMEE